MVQWFICKKNGVISVMLALILIPILAFGSILMEAARIHSAKALLSEMVDSGVFSMLAMYDPDLLSRFGLLALDPDVSPEDMDKYILEMANETLNDPHNIEKILRIQETGDISGEFLFALNDKRVLERQIMEYEKYRGPAELASSAIDPDYIIKEFEKWLTKTIPLINIVSASATAAQTIFSTIEGIWSYKDKAEAFEKAVEEYDTANSEFYDSAENLISCLQSEPEEPEKPEDMTEEDREAYNEEKKAYKEAKKEFDKEIEEEKEEFTKKKEAYEKKIKALKKAMGDYKSAHDTLKVTLKGAQNIKPNFEKAINDNAVQAAQMPDELKSKYMKVNSSIQSSCTSYAGTFDYLSQQIEGSNAETFTEYQRKLEEEYNHVKSYEVNNVTKDSSADTIAREKYLTPIKSLCNWDIITQVVNEILAQFHALADILAIITKLIKILAFFLGGPATYDMQYTVKIQDEAWNARPSETGMTGQESANKGPDKNRVQQELNKTKRVAAQIGYDINDITVSPGNDGEPTPLESEINNIVSKIQSILTKTQELSSFSITDLLSFGASKLVKVIEIVGDVISIAVSIVKVGKLLLSFLTAYLGRGILLNTYISQKFSDRTNVSGFVLYSSYRPIANTITPGHELFGYGNRIKFMAEDYLGTGNSDIAFAGAEVEYILQGNRSEIQNQQMVWIQVLFIRLLCNAVPVSSDETVTTAMEASGPFFPLVYILWLILESIIDMKLMTTMDTAVPLWKSQIFLSLEGIDDLASKIGSYDSQSQWDRAVTDVTRAFTDPIKNGMSELSGGDTDDSGEGSHKVDLSKDDDKSGKVDLSKGDEESDGTKDSKKTNKYADHLKQNLTEWKYSRYLWLLLCFHSNDTKLKRVADVIQMEMCKKRENSGKIGPFLMNKAYTYVRADVKARTSPLLPIPTIPGANRTKFNLRKIYYGGY